MKNLIVLAFSAFLFTTSFAQDSEKIVGLWNFSNVSTTNADCKDVAYFPINSFRFTNDGLAEFKSVEGIANAKYRVLKDKIKMTDLSENGVKQEGSAEFRIKEVTDTTLTLLVDYECGSIDIIFKKQEL